MDSAHTKTLARMSEPLQFRGHIPALDGLRGVAILMVLMLHFFLAEKELKESYPILGPVITKFACSGVWGVELFFVLSGFLITGILVDSRNNPNYFAAFYMRRVLRIFPLYYATLGVLFLVLPHFLSFDVPAQNMASRQGWIWIYLLNAPWARGEWGSSLFIIGHFWSLCVEEHFYLLWPLIVRLVTPSKLSQVCIGGIVFGICIRLLYEGCGHPSFLRWSSLDKLDGLFVGSFIAISCRNGTQTSTVLRWARISLLAVGIPFLGFLLMPRRTYIGFWMAFVETISVVFFGALLVFALRPETIFSRILAHSTLRCFGKYSYGIYVIHFICLPAFVRLFSLPSLMALSLGPLVGQIIFYALTISSSFLLAYVSWHLMEKRFISVKRYFEYRSGTPTCAV